MSDELTRELELATELARTAGEATLDHYRRRDLEVEHKGRSREPVTRADRASEAIILEGLRGAFPDDGILSEEQEDRSSWAGRERAWIVDPLDGTRDFLEGLEGFTVMIGLLVEGTPRLGVVFQPTTGLCFRGVAGRGAEAIASDGKRQPLACGAADEPSSLRLVVSNSHRSERTEQIKRALGIAEEQRVGSVGLKISLIARDTRDLYVHPTGHCKLWDTCAPEAILTAAGGRMTDVRGARLRYAPDNLFVDEGIVASNGRCHDQVIERVSALLPSPL